MLPCQGRDRRFESARARKLIGSFIMNKLASGIVILGLITACSSAEVSVTPIATAEGILVQGISFAEGGAANLCMIGRELQLGGTFKREDGSLNFELISSEVVVSFEAVQDQYFPFENGLYIYEGSKDDIKNGDEDYVGYDPEIWTRDCPTGPESLNG
jgi:hypothetical protein